MTTFVNDLSSFDKFADYDNYGFGAKVAAAITNKLASNMNLGKMVKVI